jgi:hypothetical protein
MAWRRWRFGVGDTMECGGTTPLLDEWGTGAQPGGKAVTCPRTPNGWFALFGGGRDYWVSLNGTAWTCPTLPPA